MKEPEEGQIITPEEAVKSRITYEKEQVLEHLRKVPIVQLACQKVGVGRTTFYRWKKDDLAFSKAVDEALEEGNKMINDMAESSLLSAIKDKNLGAIALWLKTHHPTYATKVEVTAKIQNQNEVLTPEQETLIEKALKLASLLPTREEKEENKDE